MNYNLRSLKNLTKGLTLESQTQMFLGLMQGIQSRCKSVVGVGLWVLICVHALPTGITDHYNKYKR